MLIDFTKTELQVIIAGLGELPLKISADLFLKINKIVVQYEKNQSDSNGGSGFSESSPPSTPAS